jgi:hypothetical protein
MLEGPVGVANGTDWCAKSRPGGSVLHGLVTGDKGAEVRRHGDGHVGGVCLGVGFVNVLFVNFDPHVGDLGLG